MKSSLGDQELALLEFILEKGPISVREVSEEYGVKAALARTTVQTVMERLRRKGFLTRTERGGIFEYEGAMERRALVFELIQNFINAKLGGSTSAFVAYLAQTRSVSPKELDQLKALVEKLEAES